MWRKRELLRESNVWYFARIKCGNIVSGWLWIVLSVPRTWLIVWFPEVVDRPISGMSWRSCYKNIGKNFRITPYINYAFDLINYVSLLLSSKTIANLPVYCIYTSVMNTYCVFFLPLSRSHSSFLSPATLSSAPAVSFFLFSLAVSEIWTNAPL